MTSAVPIRRLHVLVVEDNVLNQKVAEGFLDQLGCSCLVVDSGERAIAAVKQSHFDVVLMDLRMAGLDGLETTEAICEQVPADHRPKIVALTADAMAGSETRYREAGMDGFLVKPLRLATLESTLRQLFPWSQDPASGSCGSLET